MNIKDFIGQEVNVGDYFAYPLIIGRSASMAIYKLHSITDDGKGEAIKKHAPRHRSTWKYKKWVDMNDAERMKVDNKTSTLQLFTIYKACSVD